MYSVLFEHLSLSLSPFLEQKHRTSYYIIDLGFSSNLQFHCCIVNGPTHPYAQTKCMRSMSCQASPVWLNVTEMWIVVFPKWCMHGSIGDCENKHLLQWNCPLESVFMKIRV